MRRLHVVLIHDGIVHDDIFLRDYSSHPQINSYIGQVDVTSLVYVPDFICRAHNARFCNVLDS